MKRSQATKERPHGLSYSFTLHAPASDHWHRTEDDPGRSYKFKDAETLLEDFFNEVERVLSERGIGTTVVAEEAKRRLK